MIVNETTSNYGLAKPAQEEYYDIDVHNGNMDIIDSVMQDNETAAADAAGAARNAQNRIGALADLATKAKTNIVSAINEIVGGLSGDGGYARFGDLVIYWGAAEAPFTALTTVTIGSNMQCILLAAAAYEDSSKTVEVNSVTWNNGTAAVSIDTTNLVLVSQSGKLYWIAVGVENAGGTNE